MGEAGGAFIAFLLYRKGFKENLRSGLSKYPAAEKLINASGKVAFKMIILFRLIPFVPSGIVTFAASIGKVSALTFFLASLIGKIPAIIIEVLSIQQILRFSLIGKLLLGVIAIGLIWLSIRKMRKQKV